MTPEFSRGRRFAVAAVALICAVAVFRSQVADALVIRGDDYLYRGDRTQALVRYNRALAVAPDSEVAADRYVFLSLQRQTRASLGAALGVANRYLYRNPHDAPLLNDRALCYLHMREYGPAERDFERAARAAGSPEEYVFAGWAAEHAGRKRDAVALWHEALRIRPRYRSAVLALREPRR